MTLLKRLGVGVSYSPPPAVSPLAELSRREREVMQLVGQGGLGELLLRRESPRMSALPRLATCRRR